MKNDKLTADNFNALIVSHLLNNNLKEFKIYRPSRTDDLTNLILLTSVGTDNMDGTYVKFELKIRDEQ